MTSEQPTEPSNTHIVHRGQPGTGAFMLTLCQLAGPVSIRPPASPLLKAFTFFTSRVRARDGSERVFLHMGYFQTLAEAQRWVRAVNARYPDAIATLVPAAFPRPQSAAPVQPASRTGIEHDALTDTQVMRILEARAGTAAASDAESRERVELLRPDETSTRRALKDAVVRGAAVSFALQLQWSEQALDVSSVPPLAAFAGLALYATESRRDGRSRHFLRLGFFTDAIAAKDVATQVRAKFPAAAVIPVADEEVMRVSQARRDTSVIPYLMASGAQPSNAEAVRRAPMSAKPVTASSHSVAEPTDTLEHTLELLAERELLSDADTLSETGVRHLRIEVQGRTPGRP